MNVLALLSSCNFLGGWRELDGYRGFSTLIKPCLAFRNLPSTGLTPSLHVLFK